MKIIEINGVKWQAEDDFPEEILQQQNKTRTEMDAAAELAIPALNRLVEVMRHRSGQPHKVRTILYSLWNGKPTEINELLCLDWEIRKDLCQVLLAFGHESKKVKFFYKAVEAAVKEAGQWDWFLEEWDNVQRLKDFMEGHTPHVPAKERVRP